jgi:hypothetical protein
VNTSGVPSELSLSLAPNVRATIDRRVKESMLVFISLAIIDERLDASPSL